MTTSNADLNWIANYIWGIADDVLRDLYVRGKYRDVILPMTVLRRLDAVLEDTKQAVLDMKRLLDKVGNVEQKNALRAAAGQAFYNTSKFTLRDLRARASRQRLEADFRAWLDGFSPNVQDILENFEFRNQIPRPSKADALGTLIEKLTSPDVNLSPAPVKNDDGSVRHPGLDTFELKNSLTKQTVDDAVEQYRRDRNPREKLFELGRCVAHFAVDESEVRFCTHLKGKASWFLPFNRGWSDGAGNPPNTSGIKTDYLWREVLARESLTNILENYAQVVEAKDEKTRKKKRTQVWPRYHQLDVVRRLLAAAAADGAGRRYLIQHSAGSGKSNSIAWLAHQLIGLERDDAPVFDSIVVVTDRLILDRQIGDTIRQYAQVGATVGHAERSGDLRRFIKDGKKIIISTVQKFPFILAEISNEQRSRRFAIIIDEAHSSQGGRTSASISAALGTAGEEGEDETFEDRGEDPGGPVPLPRLRRQVPDRLRRAAAAHDVRRQDAVRHQGGADAVAPQPGPPEEARRLRARLPEPRRHHPRRLRRLLPGDDPAGETDPDKLHDLQADLDAAQIYSPEQVDDLVQRYLGGAERDELDPILDACVAVYVHELDEDAQVDFKGKAKAFVRTYGFLSCVLPYTNAGWEKRSIFLNFLISRLPAPDDEDLSKGILDAIDMDSYRVEKRAVQKILLPDADAEIEPVPAAGGGHRPEPELDRLSNILRAFNDLFGDIAWQDRDRVGELITKTIPAQVAADVAFRNARQNSDDANARIEHDRVLARIVTGMVSSGLLGHRRGADGRDLRRPDRDHESGRAAGGCAAFPRPAPGVAQRSADVAHAPVRHLRGARRRHRQGGRGARVPATAGAADPGAARRDPRGAVRSEAARRDGPVGTRARLLPARMSEVRGAGFSDQRIAAGPLRGPVEQQGDGVALHPRGGRRGRDPAARRTGSAEDAPLRPVLGRRGSGR